MSSNTSISKKKIGKRRRQQLNREAAAKRWKKLENEVVLVDDGEDGDGGSGASSSTVSGSPSGVHAVVSTPVAAKRKLDLMSGTPSTPLASPPEFSSPTHPDLGSSEEAGSSHEGQSSNWCIVDIGQLNQLMCLVVCPDCLTPGCLSLVKGGVQAMGFAQSLHLECKNSKKCSYQSDVVYSSPRLGGSDKMEVPFEINTSMTMYAVQLGKGYQALQDLKGALGMDCMAKAAFVRHQRKIQDASEEATTKHFASVAEVVRQAYPEQEPDGVVDITVSFDGTWQKRGFSSRHGVGSVIEVKTGLVVDFEVMSTFCHTCALAKHKLGSDTPAFEEWRQNHTDCDANFNGSSKAMEAEAARRIWSRSLELHRFRYTRYVSDGDASTQPALERLQPYGPDCPVHKMDCVNHADKRMGTALRKATADHKLGGRGPGRLTGAKASKLQKYYGRAIRQNLGDPVRMKDAIWATYLHSISTDEDPHHTMCPQGEKSWCIFNKAEALGKEMPKHGPETISTWLCKEVAEKINPIYHRMSDELLLERMLTGQTQNANESFNNLIWVFCPKNVFVGRPKVLCAVRCAVCQFNSGSGSYADKLKILGLPVSDSQASHMDQKDRERVRKAQKAAESQVREARHVRHVADREALARLEMAEGVQYGAGEF